MKKLSILFVLSVLISSCSANSELENSELELSNSEIEGKWQLVRVTGSMIPNPEVSEPSYEEYYILKSNGKFTKTRITEKDEMSASGTYSISEEEPFQEREPRKILLLTYDSKNSLIENCVATPTEHLIFESDNLLFNSWIACDGPVLEYEKVE